MARPRQGGVRAPQLEGTRDEAEPHRLNQAVESSAKGVSCTTTKSCSRSVGKPRVSCFASEERISFRAPPAPTTTITTTATPTTMTRRRRGSICGRLFRRAGGEAAGAAAASRCAWAAGARPRLLEPSYLLCMAGNSSNNTVSSKLPSPPPQLPPQPPPSPPALPPPLPPPPPPMHGRSFLRCRSRHRVAPAALSIEMAIAAVLATARVPKVVVVMAAGVAAQPVVVTHP